MSKQSDAKDRMGYKAIPETCGNCFYRTYDVYHYKNMIRVEGVAPSGSPEYQDKQRCIIGNFAVKKMATCHEWQEK